MRRRLVNFSASKLRKDFRDFDSYALQEKFKNSNDSVVVREKTLNKSSEVPQKKLSLVASAKRLEMITPTGRRNKNVVQSASVARLFAGEQLDPQKIVPVKGNFDYSDNEDFRRYLNTLKKCKGLEGELELNYDVSKNFEGKASVSLGLFFQLDEEIKKLGEVNVKSFTSENILQVFMRLTGHLREILRSLKAKQCSDEVEMLEYLWRVNAKLVDTALIAQETQTVAALDRMRENTRISMENYREETNRLELDYEKVQKKLNEDLEQTRIKLKIMKKEFTVIQEKLNQKEGLIQELSEIDRFDILKNTKKTLDELNNTLGKVVNEKRFQVKLVSRLT